MNTLLLRPIRLKQLFFQMEAKDQKQVKLQPKRRLLAYDEKQVPELRISGVWLEKAGFKAGQKVNIEIRDEQLIITTLKPSVL
jgi:hypothetical protein